MGFRGWNRTWRRTCAMRRPKVPGSFVSFVWVCVHLCSCCCVKPRLSSGLSSGLCIFSTSWLGNNSHCGWEIILSCWFRLNVVRFCILFLYIYTTSAEKAMATHSSTPAWKIPWMEEPSRLQSMGLLRVGHDWATSLSLFTFMHWRRRWQPTPGFLPGESWGRRSLVGCRLWGCTESDTTGTT